MIRTFRDSEAQKIFNRRTSRKISANLQRAVLRKLRMLNRAPSLNDLRVPPANRLEKLKGGRTGQHSIRINDKWRICFKWQKNDAYQVEIVDYH